MTEYRARDIRFLEALDYIDERFIAEVTDKYEVFREQGEYSMTPRAKVRYFTRLAAYVAAAMLFLGLVSNLPVLLQNIANLIPSGNVDPISEEEYYEKYHDPEWEYYGKYGDCYASLPSGGIDIPSSETVGGLKFNYETTAQIKIFYGGRFYTLGQAYNKGFLSAEDLKRVHLYHAEIRDYDKKYDMKISMTSIPEALHEYEIRTIMYYGYESFTNKEANRGHNWSVDCYWKKDGVYCLYIFSSAYGAYTSGRDVSIGKYTFKYGCSAELSVFSDGKFHTLEEAYKSGILTDEALGEIYDAATITHGVVKYGEVRYE